MESPLSAASPILAEPGSLSRYTLVETASSGAITACRAAGIAPAFTNATPVAGGGAAGTALPGQIDAKCPGAVRAGAGLPARAWHPAPYCPRSRYRLRAARTPAPAGTARKAVTLAALDGPVTLTSAHA